MQEIGRTGRPPCHTAASRVESLEARFMLHGGATDKVDPPVAATPDAVHVRINAGGKAAVDVNGNGWEGDRYGHGGARSGKVYDVAGTVDDRIFAQARTGKLFRYSIPVPAGSYTINLLFADPKFTAAGKRTFNVTGEDQPVLSNFDV